MDRQTQRADHRRSTLVDETGEVDLTAQLTAQASLTRTHAEAPGERAGIPVGPTALARARAPQAGPGLHPDNAGWTRLGPGNGGRVRAILVDPDPPGRIWVGSVGGGIWLSEDHGESWLPIDDLMGDEYRHHGNLSVCALVRHRQGHYFAGTGEGFPHVDPIKGVGVFHSTDGWTWRHLEATRDFGFVNSLASNGSVLLAATSGELYRSEDEGESWAPVKQGLIGRVLFDPHDPTQALASTLWQGASKVYYSQDRGKSWLEAVWEPPDGWKPQDGETPDKTSPAEYNSFKGRIELAYAAADSAVVYACVDGGKDIPTEIWRSEDGGKTFHKKSSAEEVLGRQGFYCNVIWAGDPKNDSRIVVGGINLWHSTDGGDTLTQITKGGKIDEPAVHVDQHVIAAAPTNSSAQLPVYVGNDGGIYKLLDLKNAADPGAFEELNNGFEVTQFYRGASGPSGVVLGGAQDNGVQALVGGRWVKVFPNDGGAVAWGEGNLYYGESQHLQIFRKEIDPADPPQGTGQEWEKEYICGKYPLGWAPDTGDSNRNLIPDAKDEATEFIAPFEVHPTDRKCLFAGGESLWATPDATKGPAEGPFGLNDYPDVKWRQVKAPLSTDKPQPDKTPQITAIGLAVDDRSASHRTTVYVGYSNGEVYRSSYESAAANGEAPGFPGKELSWVSLPGAPSRKCLSLAVDPRDHEQVYATFRGYKPGNVLKWGRTSAGANPRWLDRSAGLPEAPVHCVTHHPENPDHLYLATEVGVFASDDAGTTWTPTNEGPTNCAAYHLFWHGHTLICATHGRGMFQIDLAPGEKAWSLLIPDAHGALHSVRTHSGNEVRTPLGLGGRCSPPNVRRGLSFVGAGSRVVAIANDSLTELWHEELGGDVRLDAPPELATLPGYGDMLFAVDSKGRLHGVTLGAERRQVWPGGLELLHPAGGSTRILANQVLNQWLYVASDSHTHAINLEPWLADGNHRPKLAWSKQCAIPFLAAADMLFLCRGEGGNYLEAVEARTQSPVWDHPAPGALVGPPVWIQGLVLVADSSGYVTGRSFRPEETTVVSLEPPLSGGITSMTAAGHRLYAVSGGSRARLYALEVEQGPGGWSVHRLPAPWPIDLESSSVSRPVVVGDKIYVNEADGGTTVSIDRRTAAVDWRRATGGTAEAPPAPVLEPPPIDVLCVVDGRSLLKLVHRPDKGPMGKTPNNPYSLGRLGAVEKYCRMITRDGDQLLDNAVDDLQVRARIGEVVRWRGVSFTDDEECEVTITDVSSRSEGTLAPPHPVAGRKDLWQAEALAPGGAKFAIKFEVQEKVGRRRKAYFAWNPGVKVPDHDDLERELASSPEPSDHPTGDVDILCVIDAQSLLEIYGERASRSTVRLTHSTDLGKYCRMITRDRDQSRLNATSDLVVRARQGAEIRWRAVSLTDDKDYRVDITDFYCINTNVAREPTQSAGQDLWTSRVEGRRGSSTSYYLKFKVLTGDGKKRGDFDWDPGIEVI